MGKNRELILRLTEAEQELVAAANAIMQKHALPVYLFEPIVDKIHAQLQRIKRQELEEAKAREAALEDALKKPVNDTKEETA